MNVEMSLSDPPDSPVSSVVALLDAMHISPDVNAAEVRNANISFKDEKPNS
jgi:hypothetical protein